MVLFYTSVSPDDRSVKWTLYMGEDKYENDELIRYCFPNDVWFHVDDLSSAHVYIRVESKHFNSLEDLPQWLILDCCQLTKHNSIKGNKMPSVKIVFTPVKNLCKRGAMDVGQVGFVSQKAVKHIPNVSKEMDTMKRLRKTERQVPLKDFVKEYEEYMEKVRAAERARKKAEEAKKKEAIGSKTSNYDDLMSPELMVSNKDLGGTHFEMTTTLSSGAHQQAVPGDLRHEALRDFKRAIVEHRRNEAQIKRMREELRKIGAEYEKSENDLKALQSVGQMIGEILKQLTEDKFIVKTSNGPRYVVGCRRQLDRNRLKPNTRVALDMTTLTIMRYLPREVDPLVYNMSHEDPGSITYKEIGGLAEQVRELREVVELPLRSPELFLRVGVNPPKGCLLYGPPGTGKTLLARAVASQMDCNFLKVVSSTIVDKYIGESARMIREMFNYARDHEPCIVFMDEIDAIGGRRFSEGSSADREIQRTLMELLNQMDGFDALGKVKIIMATNRPDTLDPALLRPGRLDRKIEIPLPNENARLEILKIHSRNITKKGNMNFDAVVRLADGFNGADLRNVCTEAGLFAIRDQRGYVLNEDFMKAVRKVADAKKLETKLDYKPV
ncbi:hypothetical protein ACOME3_000111 [Neoechinorhynchus agilis]